MERVFRIINILLNREDYITIDSIAATLGTSNKTVRNDLKKAEDSIKDKGLMLVKKPGCGVRIQGEESKKLELINRFKTVTDDVEPFSPEDRENYILKKLLMSEENITMKELASELYVSRVTIHKDLEYIEDWIKDYNLRLLRKPNYGIEIVGDEENLRKAVADIIVKDKGNDELKEILYKDYYGRIDYKTTVRLKELIDIQYKQLEKIIVNAEESLKFKFSDEAFISLIIHIAIAIKRLQQNKDINLSEDILNNLKEKEEYCTAERAANEIEKCFNVKFPESEVGYITLHLLGAKMQQDKVGEVLSNILNDKDELPNIMAKEIIEKAEKILCVHLSEDKQLLNGLILHLRPTINRLKYGLTLRNPIIDEIKENYPEIYGAAWMTSSIFKKYLGVKIPDEEIGYIAIHIAAAVERLEKSLNALVVCSSGIGTSQLLAVKLMKHFGEIRIKDVVSYASIMERNLEDIDIIISTVAIKIDKPTINISPLLTQNDIRRLNQFINNINYYKKYKVGNIINEDYIFLNQNFSGREMLIKCLCEKLYKGGYVKDEYLSTVLNREKKCSTEVGNKVAIPHGNPQYVNRSSMCVVTLNKPIKWNEEQVDIVFFINISEKDIKRFERMFRYLYNKIDEVEFLEKLRGEKDKKNVIKLLADMDSNNDFVY